MRIAGVLAVCGIAAGCADRPSGDGEAGSTSNGPTTKGDNPLETSSSASTVASTSASTVTTQGETSSDASTTTAASSEGSSGSTTTGAAACDKRVLLMGYWPPTNEMLRPWSTDPAQNPGGWIGEDWHGHGYDVYSFFPEFPPDGDPTNDAIGQDGAVGSPDFPLRVDYQATSADFWALVDEHQPLIVLTTSRGGEIGWEIEAVEGGHGDGNGGDPSLDWTSDAHGADTQPTMATIDARSWDAITTYRQRTTLPSALPMQEIFDATSVLGLTDVAIDETGTSGPFLSGFLGLHGVYWQHETPHAVAAGHIHVGFGLPVEDASMLVEATLEAILLAHPADGVDCPQ